MLLTENLTLMNCRKLFKNSNPVIGRLSGDKRFCITVPMRGAFSDPMLFANPIAHSIIGPLLEYDVRLDSFTAVTSYPGAKLQHTHRDHVYLFRKARIGAKMLPHAFSLFVPLIDVDLKTGPTALSLGSHKREDSEDYLCNDWKKKSLKRGDCLIIDYRLIHRGMPNNTQNVVRPVLFMVFSRSWFF